MKFVQRIELPQHIGPGGFDHADVDELAARLYIAHTANDTVDVIHCVKDRFLFSIPNLTGVAGVLVSEMMGYIFTSNRGEDTVGILRLEEPRDVQKVRVGVRPNGLSVDHKTGLLLAANVGNPEIPGSTTLSMLDVERREMIHSIPVPGRTRWTIFDEKTGCFYVNIADPPQIVVVEAAEPGRIARSIEVPAAGPHGMDIDADTGRLFCACDAGKLFALEAESGRVLGQANLSGTPDVMFFNGKLKHLYVAVGDPGVVDVFDSDHLRRIETISTQKGAHTLGHYFINSKIYVLEPGSHSAAVYVDETR
jgi:DNA-binding beta-propeller fold protein YncE